MIEEHLTATHHCSAYELLKDHTKLPGERLKQAARFGCVWLESGSKPKRLRRLKQSLKPGDVIHLYLNQDLLCADIPSAKCIADEGDYSIWYKPRGIFSQGSKWGDAHSIARFAELTLERPSYLVHRLDRMTAGLMIIAHRKKLVRYFTELFSKRHIRKHYYAVVQGRPEQAIFTISEPLDERPAETGVTFIKYHQETDRSLLSLELMTGRKHQIRRHLSMMGLPIVGDRQYGKQTDDIDLQLLSAFLAFPSPVGSDDVVYQLTADQVASDLSISPSNSG